LVDFFFFWIGGLKALIGTVASKSQGAMYKLFYDLQRFVHFYIFIGQK